jgi:hypothetical protein
MWGLPLQSHRYLIDEPDGQQAEFMMIIRYVKFIQSLTKSPNWKLFPILMLMSKTCLVRSKTCLVRSKHFNMRFDSPAIVIKLSELIQTSFVVGTFE